MLRPLPHPGAAYEQGCFHAQQAAEKSLKALLISRSCEPPYIHNLQVLLDLLAVPEPTVSEIVESASLTAYAVLTRYPHLGEPVTEEEWRRAADLALRVVRWVEQRL